MGKEKISRNKILDYIRFGREDDIKSDAGDEEGAIAAAQRALKVALSMTDEEWMMTKKILIGPEPNMSEEDKAVLKDLIKRAGNGEVPYTAVEELLREIQSKNRQ